MSYLFTFVICFYIVITATSGSPNRYDDEVEYQMWNTWESPPGFETEFPAYLAGYDFDERPVWILDLGKWDVNAVVRSGFDRILAFENYTEQFRFRLYNSPFHAPGGLRDPNLEELDDVTVDSYVLLVNMDKFDLKQLTNPKALQLYFNMWTLIDIATENMEYGFILNTNFIAERFFNTLKPVMGETLAKMFIRGTRQQTWLPEVLKFIPIDVLPESYGGHGYARINLAPSF